MKVIASSLRKGNIVELDDGKLYVVLNAESFHPGKGTPTTQVDMRRISDGVKTAQRYKTTEQVERAHVEDREHQFLYSDSDGFHFMNTENFDQVQVREDVVGDSALYLQPEMKVMLSVFEDNAVAIQLPNWAKHINVAGVTSKVSAVAKPSPKTIATDRCTHHWVDGAPIETLRVTKSILIPKAIASPPNTAVTAVSTTGRARSRHVSMIAS